MKILTIVILSIFSIVNCGCEDTDIRLATEAGVEAYKAVALSDEDVAMLSGKMEISSHNLETVQIEIIIS